VLFRSRLDVSSFTKNISSVLTPDFLPGLQKELDSKISQINAINSQISALYAPKNKPPGWNNKTDSNSKGPGLPPVSPPEAAIKKRTEKDPKDLGDAHVKAYQDELRNRMDSYIEFQDEYKKLTLSSFALESMEIDALGNKYIQAGADKIQVDAWVAYEKAAIRTAELEDEREKAEERLRASQYWADGAIRGLQDYAAQASDAASSVESMFTNAFSNLEDALVNFVMTGKLSFSDLVNSMIADIVRLSIQQSITAPLASALASGMSSVFGGWAGTGTGSYSSADGSMSSTFATYNKFGNAFGHDGIHPFAKGGAFTNRIYNQPTPFMFGSGGAFGVMGEAGDEAVMPLARTSSGELGVKSSGSSPVINVTINNQASGATGRVASSSPNGSGGMDLTVIIEQIDGAIASGIGTGRSATASALEGTYGLNRAYGAMR
jgi:lambda family phage tail tape measure protein